MPVEASEDRVEGTGSTRFDSVSAVRGPPEPAVRRFHHGPVIADVDLAVLRFVDVRGAVDAEHGGGLAFGFGARLGELRVGDEEDHRDVSRVLRRRAQRDLSGLGGNPAGID